MFDARSKANLAGVHPDLHALAYSVERWYANNVPGYQLRVTSGVRTPGQQAQLLADKRTWTLDSKHLIQPSGYGHAIDFALLDPEFVQDFAPYVKLALVVQRIAIDEQVRVVWGGIFDRELTGLSTDLWHERDLYEQRCRARRVKPKMDAFHFELA